MNVFLDDEREPHQIYGGGKWVLARDIELVKNLLMKNQVDDLSLDHDLGFDPGSGELRETGYDLCKWMAENNRWPKGKILVHSQNPVGRANMQAIIDNKERYQQFQAGLRRQNVATTKATGEGNEGGSR